MKCKPNLHRLSYRQYALVLALRSRSQIGGQCLPIFDSHASGIPVAGRRAIVPIGDKVIEAKMGWLQAFILCACVGIITSRPPRISICLLRSKITNKVSILGSILNTSGHHHTV